MNKSAGVALTFLGGLLSATLALLPLVPIPGLAFFSYFTCIPLFLLGLGIGLKPLYGAGVVGSLLLLLVEGPYLAGEYFLFSFLGPAFLVNRALLHRQKKSGEVQWYPASLLLRDLTLASCIVMLIGLAVYLYITEGGHAEIILKPLLKIFDPQGQLKQFEPVLLTILPIIPGFFAVSWSIMILINGVLAQGLLVNFKKNSRPSLSSEEVSLSKGFLIAFSVSLVLSFISLGSLQTIAKNLAFVLSVPYFLIGLSMIHSWFKKTAYPTLGLTFFYLLLLLLLWPLLIVILLGILKPWIEKTFSSN